MNLLGVTLSCNVAGDLQIFTYAETRGTEKKQGNQVVPSECFFKDIRSKLTLCVAVSEGLRLSKLEKYVFDSDC